MIWSNLASSDQPGQKNFEYLKQFTGNLLTNLTAKPPTGSETVSQQQNSENIFNTMPWGYATDFFSAPCTDQKLLTLLLILTSNCHYCYSSSTFCTPDHLDNCLNIRVSTGDATDHRISCRYSSSATMLPISTARSFLLQTVSVILAHPSWVKLLITRICFPEII